MKQLLIISAFLLFYYFGNCQTNPKFFKTWMPIGSINEKGEVSSTDFQQIITFKRDSIKATFFGKEKDTLLSYSIKGDSMFYSGVATRLFLVNDSILRIDIYGQTVVFKTISEGNESYTAPQLLSALQGNEWKFINKDSGERFFSFDSITREAYRLKEGTENVFSFDKFNIYKSHLSQEFGFWAVKNVKGQIFLNLEIVDGSNDFRILQLRELKENEIIFRSWVSGKEKEIIFRKVPKLSKAQTEIFNSKLTQEKWLLTSAKAIKTERSSFSHSTIDYYQSIDTTLLIKKEDLKLKNISYQFNRDLTFSIFIDNRKAYSGIWSILLGGKVVKLEEKWHGEENWYPLIGIDKRIYERFLQIKSLKANVFHFTREEKLYTGFGSYEMEYIDQKYRKRR